MAVALVFQSVQLVACGRKSGWWGRRWGSSERKQVVSECQVFRCWRKESVLVHSAVSGTGQNMADRSKCILTLIILYLHRISGFVKDTHV